MFSPTLLHMWPQAAHHHQAGAADLWLIVVLLSFDAALCNCHLAQVIFICVMCAWLGYTLSYFYLGSVTAKLPFMGKGSVSKPHSQRCCVCACLRACLPACVTPGLLRADPAT
jgi:hypothetical protein